MCSVYASQGMFAASVLWLFTQPEFGGYVQRVAGENQLSFGRGTKLRGRCVQFLFLPFMEIYAGKSISQPYGVFSRR